MTKLGYQVEIAALHPSYNTLHERVFFKEKIKVSYVAQMHVRQEGHRRLYFNPTKLLIIATTATVALAKAAITSHADVIHIAKAQPMNGMAGWLGAHLDNRPLYLDCDDDESASNRFGSAWQRQVVDWWEKRLPKVVKGVTVNTEYLRDRCLRLGVLSEKIRLVPNGFDPERFKLPAPQEVEMIRQKWGLANRQVILYMGSLSLANHPILLLLDAFEQVRKHLLSAVLLLVGGGEDYDRLAKEIQARGISDSVLLAGRVDPESVASIYAASHLVVDPVYDDEAARARSPLKIVESLAMGVPVVTGDSGDRTFMLDGGKAGVLVKPGSAEALADGIISALNDQDYYQSMAEQARLISEQFRWDHLAKEFVKVYGL